MLGENSSTVVPKTEKMTMRSPYSLSSSDNPVAMIGLVVLNRDNYEEWGRDMFNALQAKRKTGFINGTIKKPPSDDPNYENWIAVNSMIVGWIRASIEPKVKSTLLFIMEAAQVWSELKQRLSVGNQVRVHQVNAQIMNCRQNGKSVVEYYGHMCNLWDKLQAFKSLPNCSCGASVEYSKERDEEKVHQFVLGLDDSRFGSVCTTIIGMEPLPSLGEAYSRVTREESRLNSARIREHQQEAVGFVTRGEQHDSNLQVAQRNSQLNVAAYYGSAKPENSILKTKERYVVCSHCNRPGHEKRDCWHIIDFPNWWTERAEKQDRNSVGQNSSGRGRGGRGSSLMSPGRGRGHAMNAHATSSNSSNSPELTQDQWKALQQLLAKKSSAGNSDKLSGPFFEDADWTR